MQDVCISLEVADPIGLPVALHKVLRVLSSLPRLERFVADVCEVSLPARHLHYAVVWNNVSLLDSSKHLLRFICGVMTPVDPVCSGAFHVNIVQLLHEDVVPGNHAIWFGVPTSQPVACGYQTHNRSSSMRPAIKTSYHLIYE